MKKYLIPAIGIPALFLAQLALGEEFWSIQTVDEWKAAIESSEGVTIEKGVASPICEGRFPPNQIEGLQGRSARPNRLPSSSPRFGKTGKRSRVIGPKNLRDAPVFLTMGPGDYWMFGQVRRHAQEER